MNKIIVVFLCMLLTVFCKPQEDSKIDKVMYLFADNPIPTGMHRSYEITVTRKLGSIKIIGHDTIYKNVSFSIAPAMWKKIADAAKKADLNGLNYNNQNHENCKAYTIGSFYKQQPLGVYEWSDCEKNRVQEKYIYFKTLIESSVPDLNALIEATRKKL